MEENLNCLVCDRFDDVAFSVTSLEEIAKYTLSLLTEIELNSSDVLCFGCHGKLTVSTSFLKMCRSSQRCLERKAKDRSNEDLIDSEDYQEVFLEELEDPEEVSTTLIASEKVTVPTTDEENDHKTSSNQSSTTQRNIYTDADYDDLTCEYCFDKFNNAEQRKDHEATHLTEDRPYRCYICTQKFSTRASLRSHYESHMDLTWPCTFEGCKKTFKTKHGRWTHEYKHKNDMKPCHLCGKLLTTTWAVNQHIKEMHTELPFHHECNICQKKFKSQKALYNHSIIHDENKRKHECQVCQKRFFTRAKLKRHQEQVHSEEKSFTCTQTGCSYKSGNSYNLNRHLQTHQAGSNGS